MHDTYLLAILLAFQAPAICIVICAYVFFALRRNGITQKQFIQIRCMAVGCVGYMACEVLRGMIGYGVLDWSIGYVSFFSTIAYCFLLFDTVAFSEFCISRTDNATPLMCRLIRVMYFVTCAALIARAVFSGTELFTYFGEDGKVMFGPLDDLQTWGCVVIDLLLTALLAHRYADKSEYVNREKNGKMLFVTAAVTAVTLIYLVLLIPYIIWMGYMLALMILFSGLQGLLIDRDELTSLSNRRRMLKDIEEKNRERIAWSYIFLDVNSFKQVNDVYGHNEGDRALTIIAAVLDAAATGNNAAAYRIGGDEFAIIIPSEDETAVNGLCGEIERQLSAQTAKENLPYELTISFGYAMHGEIAARGVPEIMEMADQRMYADKRRSVS